MAIRIGRSAEADRYAPGGRNYRGPIFGQQQQPQLSMSIPTGGFMGSNQIGGQSAINVFRTPRPEPTLEELKDQAFRDRAEKYQREEAEFNLGQREADLQQRIANQTIQEGRDRNAAAQIAGRYYILDGEPVSAEEMKAASGRYLSEYTTPTPEQERANSIQQSLTQFRQNPMQFIFGGGQNVGELLGYLNQLNQLFSYSGQEGNFIDLLFGSSRARSGNVPTQSIQNRRENREQQRQDLARREEEKQRSRSSSRDSNITPNNVESASARLARLGIRPGEQSQILGAFGPRGRGTFVSSAFAQR